MATIGIDVTALSSLSPGGIGTSQYRTMRALAQLGTDHRFVMYAAAPPLVPFTDRALDLPWELRIGTGPATRSNIVWMQTGINSLLAADHVDVFWSPRHLLPFRARSVATVATIQDFWDRYFPAQQPWANRTANRLLIDRVVRTADKIVTASAATAHDVTRFFGVPREEVTVVPLGVDPGEFSPAPSDRVSAVKEAHGIKKPYLLSLDVYNPRKNFGDVLRAVALISERDRDGFEIVGVGRPRRTASEIDPFAKAVALGVRRQMHLVDDLPADDLVALLSGALAFVYPSVYEGFGMPILEAMSCGAPVITSDRSSLPEVAGDAALLVDPESPSDLAAAISRILGDEGFRKQLAAAGRVRAATFTWERTARGMLAVFEDVLVQREAGSEH